MFESYVILNNFIANVSKNKYLTKKSDRSKLFNCSQKIRFGFVYKNKINDNFEIAILIILKQCQLF